MTFVKSTLLLLVCFYCLAVRAQHDTTGTKKVDELEKVEIRIKKPLLDHQPDRTIVNVQSMISAPSLNTLEVLERVPGVTVDQNGNISLNGKGGVLVLIDGRQQYMSAQDLAAYLKSLPGAVVDKLELMDNPPSKYDAAGGAVINIRLKRNREAGVTGNVSLGYTQGSYPRTNSSFNINYHRKKLNVFAMASYTTEKSYNTDISDRTYFDERAKIISMVDLYNRQVYRIRGVNINAGAEYSLSEKTNVGLTLNLSEGRRRGWFEYDSRAFDADEMLQHSNAGTTTGNDSRTNKSANLTLTHQFNKRSELSADVSYMDYRSSGNRLLINSYYDAANVFDSSNSFEYVLPADALIYVAKADYVLNAAKDFRFEAGVKSSVVTNNNLNDEFRFVNGVAEIDHARSDHFRYEENVNAAYVNGQKSWRRFAVQLGLRAENTISSGEQLGKTFSGESTFRKNYTQLFPTTFLSYKLDSVGSRVLTLILSRRISRPNYQSMNPFVYFRDEYSYTTGNPLLTPQFQTRYEVKYQHKRWLTVSVHYNSFDDVIFSSTEAVGQVFITKPTNVGKGTMLMMTTGVNLQVTPWWQINSTMRAARLQLKGRIATELLEETLGAARVEVINFLNFKKGLSAELGGYYASRDLMGQGVTSGIYRVNASLQKKILKEKGSIRISCDDIFHSWVYKNRSIGLKQAEYLQTTFNDSRRVGLAFTYRFGQDKFGRKRGMRNAADEEKGRLD